MAELPEPRPGEPAADAAVPLHGTRTRYKLDRERFLKELMKCSRQPLSDETTDSPGRLLGVKKPRKR